MLIGRELRSNGFVRLAITLGFAPAPNPFTYVLDHAPDAERGMAFGCRSKNGIVEWHSFDYRMRNRFQGPHERIAVYIALAYTTRYQFEVSGGRQIVAARLSRMYQTAMRSAFCHGGPLGREYGCDPTTPTVLARLNNSEGRTISSMEISCR